MDGNGYWPITGLSHKLFLAMMPDQGTQLHLSMMFRGEQLIYEAQVMGFGGGDSCDGTPRRAAVYFECAADNALVSVSEPSPCVYSAWFATPSACDPLELRRRQAALTTPASA